MCLFFCDRNMLHTSEIKNNLTSVWTQSKKKRWLLPRVLLFWEKHHLNLLKTFTDIILALDKIKTIINIIVHQYRCTVTKNLFWKSTSCGKVLFWAGTDGSMKEKWKYFVYVCIHLHCLSVLPDGKESFLTDVNNLWKMIFSNELW